MDTVRARDLGIPFDGTPGDLNAITDVPGVEVGYATLIHGEPGDESVARTGVTAILPRGRAGVGVPCAAGTFSLNGNGELTGRAWIDESGSFSTPIALTNSHAVGAVHRGVDEWVHETHPEVSVQWMLPVVGETWDARSSHQTPRPRILRCEVNTCSHTEHFLISIHRGD